MSASPSMAGGNRGLWALRVPLEHLGARRVPGHVLAGPGAHGRSTPRGGSRTTSCRSASTRTIVNFMDLVEASKHYPCVKRGLGGVPRRTGRPGDRPGRVERLTPRSPRWGLVEVRARPRAVRRPRRSRRARCARPARRRRRTTSSTTAGHEVDCWRTMSTSCPASATRVTVGAASSPPPGREAHHRRRDGAEVAAAGPGGRGDLASPACGGGDRAALALVERREVLDLGSARSGATSGRSASTSTLIAPPGRGGARAGPSASSSGSRAHGQAVALVDVRRARSG